MDTFTLTLYWLMNDIVGFLNQPAKNSKIKSSSQVVNTKPTDMYTIVFDNT